MFIRSTRSKELQSWTDHQLVQAFCGTNQERYFNELFQRYTHLAYGACLRWLEDTEISKDIVMAVFAQAYQMLPRQEVREFKNWLYILVRNQCADYLRRRRSEGVAVENWQVLQKNEDNFMENGSELRLYKESEAEANRLIDTAIAKLNDEQRVCIQLFFYQRKSYKEIAALTQFSEKQVKSYLQNGKRQLRQTLNDLF